MGGSLAGSSTHRERLRVEGLGNLREGAGTGERRRSIMIMIRSMSRIHAWVFWRGVSRCKRIKQLDFLPFK
jgi:hypothetical protein